MILLPQPLYLFIYVFIVIFLIQKYSPLGLWTGGLELGWGCFQCFFFFVFTFFFPFCKAICTAFALFESCCFAFLFVFLQVKTDWLIDKLQSSGLNSKRCNRIVKRLKCMWVKKRWQVIRAWPNSHWPVL